MTIDTEQLTQSDPTLLLTPIRRTSLELTARALLTTALSARPHYSNDRFFLPASAPNYNARSFLQSIAPHLM